MPMNRDLYPPDWEAIAFRVKERADWRCEKCSKQCYRPGEPAPDKRFVLTVAHLNHTPADCRDENLAALCAPCHIRYDAAYKALKRRVAALLDKYAKQRERQRALALDAGKGTQ